MIFDSAFRPRHPLRAAITETALADETETVTALVPLAEFDQDSRARIGDMARRLVAAVREHRLAKGGMDAFMSEYDLSSQEGVLLMCLAEALLRIPDSETADRLIRDKLGKGKWDAHLGRSESLFVNASTWGLMLTGNIVRLDQEVTDDAVSYLGRWLARGGEPVIRTALLQAMQIMSRQFVMGRTIEEALERSRSGKRRQILYSYDMLGEAALCHADAERYFEAYHQAIKTVAHDVTDGSTGFQAPSISVKLSALHPRFEFSQRSRVMNELVPRVTALAGLAKDARIGLTLDTEEADRLELTLDVYGAVYGDPKLAGWEGFGIAVQAYQKRALAVLAWLQDLAGATHRCIPVRLVKGAYWDTEIKRAQERGLKGYPVFTRKVHTDVSYLACAKQLLAAGPLLYPQFATHNAHTAAAVMTLARDRSFEMQRLHGMGEALYAEIDRCTDGKIPCRVYAPVGSHAALLPYLVRRLLENGANTSFVNRVVDAGTLVEAVIADPVMKLRDTGIHPHARIPVPSALYGVERCNAYGIDLTDEIELQQLDQSLRSASAQPWEACPLINGKKVEGVGRSILDPSQHDRVVGTVQEADPAVLEHALTIAADAAPAWARLPAEARADCLDRSAGLFEQRRAELMALCVREGGKCLPDALAELREAVDYCRYYAALARKEFARPKRMPGPTGERNELHWRGRGVFACISPWNFPLAIFVGQIGAALAAGNAVIAKPAGQTPLVAALALGIMHQAGVPAAVLQLLPGKGPVIGNGLVGDARISGVAFTGSTETAQKINRRLAERSGKIIPFIAETGGINAMIVDSSALPEQAVTDIVQSAFNSAGQRCSALRLLFLQQEVADPIIELLRGAMAELRIGDPAQLSTDIGPVIDTQAKVSLERHTANIRRRSKLIYQLPLPDGMENGNFFPPCAFEMEDLEALQNEVFGPILHVVRYRSDHLNKVLDAVHHTGYGLTLGIHSRIDETARIIQEHACIGNIYVNRNMIGAVVGVQPFGGEGLSGTGPKAGGPHYLYRFATERTVSTNTAAVGGNTGLLSLNDRVPTEGV